MKLLKEPLLHFLVLGALVFWLSRHFGAEAGNRLPADQLIEVPAGKIEQLSSIFAKTWQRPPTRDELQGLVDDYILEEAYVREALKMGLEDDDTIIRRRLRQKLEFLTGDMMSLTQPGDEDLQGFLEANPDRFREDPRVDLRQVFFNPEKLGPDPEAEMEESLARLRAGEDVEGHPTLLPGFRPDAPLRSIAATFGSDFTEQLATVPVGEWQGPLRSGFGLHFVRVEQRTPGRLPELAEIRDAVQREWAHERKQEMTRQFNQELLDNYQIEVEWPEPADSEP